MMKDETRREYEETIHKGKKSLQEIAELAQKANCMNEEWQPLWGKLDKAQAMLMLPMVETIDVSNLVKPTIRGINKLVGMLTGQPTVQDQIQAEEDAILSLPEESLTKRVIKLIQGAEQTLLQAFDVIVREHPAVEHLPTVQEIKMVASRVNMLPREINKIRGL